MSDANDLTIFLAAAERGDSGVVRAMLDVDRSLALAKGGAKGWDALTYLSFSDRLPRGVDPSPEFVDAARALLEAGASANTGWYDNSHMPEPALESVLYGAAGIAHNLALTKLLLEHGADPNDGEAVYHSPETWDEGNRAMEAIVETGRLTPRSLSLMLVRKHDFHDYDGVKWLLEHGADPNSLAWWSSRTPLGHGVQRDNDSKIIEIALQRSGDPTIAATEGSAEEIAARRGRGDLLTMFDRAGFASQLQGVDRLLAACAKDDVAEVQRLTAAEPALVDALLAQGADRLAEFAGTGNVRGLVHLLDLGVPIAATYRGDGYFGIPAGTTALHVAAWRARHSAVALLLERGAPVNARDTKAATPLMYAVRACVDSYWQSRRAPDSVRALLNAAASMDGVPYPSGYDAVDALIADRRKAS